MIAFNTQTAARWFGFFFFAGLFQIRGSQRSVSPSGHKHSRDSVNGFLLLQPLTSLLVTWEFPVTTIVLIRLFESIGSAMRWIFTLYCALYYINKTIIRYGLIKVYFLRYRSAAFRFQIYLRKNKVKESRYIKNYPLRSQYFNLKCWKIKYHYDLIRTKFKFM